MLRFVAVAGRVAHMAARGGLAARHTGAERVHLIGTAATPLGGDHIAVTVLVGPGARLSLRGVAATMALPGRGTLASSAHWHFEVAEGGELDVDTPAMIVAGGAEHATVTSVGLAACSRLRLREQVQIGRTGERHGRWRGDLIADLGELPLVRHRLELGAGVATDDALTAPRALISELCYPDERPASTTGLDAARLPLALGGSLSTGLGETLAHTRLPG
ncbi:urease accessory protein UreD [Nocardia farcinica]|uniref:urease accessory protein UreD n=1 Tax=Nocardia farcinica TaxID=37329 RepID=UPI003D7B4E1B